MGWYAGRSTQQRRRGEPAFKPIRARDYLQPSECRQMLRIQFVTEGPLPLSANAARTEFGGRRIEEARRAPLTEFTLRPLGGDFGMYPLVRKKHDIRVPLSGVRVMCTSPSVLVTSKSY